MSGGDPWGATGSAIAPPSSEYLRFAPGAMAQAEGDVPVEVLIRSKSYFEFLEPVEIEPPAAVQPVAPDIPAVLPQHVPARSSQADRVRRLATGREADRCRRGQLE